MKLFYILIFICPFVLFSQEKSNEVHTFIDEEAQFPGGYSAMMKFMNENLENYPVEGKLFLRIIVEKDGTISDVTVVKAIEECPECSNNAIQVIKSMPQWTPAKVQGKNVRTYFNLPITYRK